MVVVSVEAARHGHKTHARLHQPPSEQHSLAERGTAIAVADFLGLILDLERFLGLRRMHQREGRLIIRIHALADTAGIQAAELVIDEGKQRTAAVHARPIDAHG